MSASSGIRYRVGSGQRGADSNSCCQYSNVSQVAVRISDGVRVASYGANFQARGWRTFQKSSRVMGLGPPPVGGLGVNGAAPSRFEVGQEGVAGPETFMNIPYRRW